MTDTILSDPLLANPVLAGLVPAALAPQSRKIMLQDFDLPVDIGFHDFEIGTPQRLRVNISNHARTEPRPLSHVPAHCQTWRKTSTVISSASAESVNVRTANA